MANVVYMTYTADSVSGATLWARFPRQCIMAPMIRKPITPQHMYIPTKKPFMLP